MVTKVICKNHGVIQVIDLDGVMWVGEPPTPWKFCPHCGEKTVVERIEYQTRGAIYQNPTPEEIAEAKQREVDFYRKKYWDNEFPEK